ncbi:MAG: PilW family protein [Steroidobacteraceae bacterium]
MSRREQGIGLIELLVALAIGSVLIVGAVYVYSQSSSSYRVSDATSRLQEDARYAFSIIEPDVQLAGYYGFSNSPDDFKYITGGATSSAVPASRMQAASAALAGLPSGFQSCGNNFAVNLVATVEGSNDAYTLACAAEAGGAEANTDTLTIRRASRVALAAATGGRLQLLVSRLSPTNQYMLSDGSLPATPALDPETVQVRDLVVRSYYISTDSEAPTRVGLPALRVKTLVDGDFTDEQVMPGVEDLQVQFGIDTGDYDNDGVIDPGLDADNNGIPDAPRGIATRYVNADALPVGFQVVAVRLWLMMRSAQFEAGFVDGRTYDYADKSVSPGDGSRRMLVSRTIQLRNARQL